LKGVLPHGAWHLVYQVTADEWRGEVRFRLLIRQGAAIAGWIRGRFGWSAPWILLRKRVNPWPDCPSGCGLLATENHRKVAI